MNLFKDKWDFLVLLLSNVVKYSLIASLILVFFLGVFGLLV